MHKPFLLTITLGTIFALSIVFWQSTTLPMTTNHSWAYAPSQISLPNSAAPPTPTAIPLPVRKVLQNDYHIFQSFNNCGPASYSMLLSYYGITQSQEILGQALRPYQNALGDNDDKSVTLAEIAQHAKTYDLKAYYLPTGDISLLKSFIANDIPVLTRTWLKLDEDIGHFRVVKGYDDMTQQLIQDDSLQGKNLTYSYDEFSALWKKFNYEYIVLVPKEKETVVNTILGGNTDEKKAWQTAYTHARQEVEKNPADIYATFNLSVAAYHAGDYAASVTAFETVETQLPWRTLWYQIEPILAYYELNNDERVLQLTSAILSNQNRAFSELYVLRGNVYKRQGKRDAARYEYEQAVLYNTNLQEAKEALENL